MMNTPFDCRKAAEFLRRKQKKQEALRHIRFRKAWKDFDRIAAMVIEKYHPERIYQWGRF